VDYLGHIISHNKVRVDNRKIEAMQSWAQAKNHHEALRFFGSYWILLQICAKLNYGLIPRPLTNLLKREIFCRTQR
jgi:hypothetical protein